MRQHHVHRPDVPAPVGASGDVGVELGERLEARDQLLLQFVRADHVVPGDEPLARGRLDGLDAARLREQRGIRRPQPLLDGRVPDPGGDDELLEPGVAERGPEPSRRLHRAQSLDHPSHRPGGLEVPGVHARGQPRRSLGVRPHRHRRDAGGRDVQFRQADPPLHGRAGPGGPLHRDLGVRHRVPDEGDAHLGRPLPGRMDHGHEPSGSDLPAARLLAAEDAPEVDRVEGEVLVERVHRGDPFLVEIQQEVRLAHLDVQEEIPEEGLVLQAQVAARVLPRELEHPGLGVELVVVPEPLRVGADVHVGDLLAVHRGAEPAARVVDLRRRDVGEILAGGEARGEAVLVQDPSHVVRDLHLVLHRPRVHLHELGVIDVDAQFAGQDPVDREDLLEPADVLPVPALVRRVVRGREPDRDPADVLVPDRREHVVGEPTEPLLVGADDPDPGLRGAGLPERGFELLLEAHPEIGRLADQDLDLHPVPRTHPRHHVGGEPLAQLVHLPAEVEFLVEHGDRSVA